MSTPLIDSAQPDNIWDFQVEQPYTGINLTPIQEASWGREYEANDKPEFRWDGPYLEFRHTYRGEAHILDTSKEGKRSFTICLKNKDKTPNEYDLARNLCFDLSEYVKESATFKILKEDWGNSASVLGTIEYPPKI